MERESGQKAKVTTEIELTTPNDWGSDKEPMLYEGDNLSLIEVKKDRYGFSILKFQGTGASYIELYDDEFEWVEGNWKNEN